MFWIYVLAPAWITCSCLAYGMLLALAQRMAREVDQDAAADSAVSDVLASAVLSIFGPASLAFAFWLTRGDYGFLFWPEKGSK